MGTQNTIIMEHYNIIVMKHCRCCVDKEKIILEGKIMGLSQGDMDKNVQDMY